MEEAEKNFELNNENVCVQEQTQNSLNNEQKSELIESTVEKSLNEVKNSELSQNSNLSTPKRSNQLEYIQRIVLRALWKHPQSWPFREPVDPVRDNANDYYDIIKTPMDLGTIRSKLLNGQYKNADECIQDFRLIFKNCYIYNSEGLMVRNMCETLEKFFNEKLDNMPQLSTDNEKDANNETKSKIKHDNDFSLNSNYVTNNKKNGSVSRKRQKDNAALRTPSKKKKIVDNSDADNTNPITPSKTNSKDSVSSTRRDPRRSSLRPNGSRSTNYSESQYLAHTDNIPTLTTSNALKYCLSMVRELYTKKHADYAWPFYDPVDPNALQLGDYDSIIHYPIDLNTIRKNLESGRYSTSFECISDLRRMVTNSCRYNPETHIVNQAGQRLIVAIEMLIARAPPDVYDFLVVVPNSIIIPAIDSKPEAIRGAIALSKLSHGSISSHLGGNIRTDDKLQRSYDEYNQSRTINNKKTNKLKKEEFIISDDDLCDDEYVNPLRSKAHHGGGFTNVECLHAEPMTYEEKRKLSLEINRMPTEKLGEIIAFLSDMESDIFKEKNQSEVEIDFDSMKAETLRSLEKYVKYLNKPPKSRKKKPISNHTIASKSSSSITNISNPLTSTLKNFSGSSDNINKFSNHHNKFQVLTSLPLSEESDYSDNEYQGGGGELNSSRPINASFNKNNSLIGAVHSNISVSKTSTNNVSTRNNIIAKSSDNISVSTDAKLTFDTVDDSMLPPSMLDISKRPKESPTDLINEAKEVVRQQKIVNLNSTSTVSSNHNPSLNTTPSTCPSSITNSNYRHTVSVLTSSSTSASVVNTPEIRGDTNAPKAPTTLEERERMKEEERKRRFALASGTQTNFNGDTLSSFEN